MRGSWGHDLGQAAPEAWVCLCTNMHLGREKYTEVQGRWWPNPRNSDPGTTSEMSRGDFPLWSTGQFPELSVLGFAGALG